ncbi:MAG: Sec-independent protein translocase protein TatB [Acidimicrobiales bacterium]
MFNIGGGELIVIALIALIVLGPQRLPDAARQVGKTLGELRRISSGFQRELRDAFDDTDVGDTTAKGALGPAPTPNGSVAKAVSDVSADRPTRRAPLQASPPSAAPKAKAKAKANGTAAKPGAARRAPLRAGDVSATPPPRTKGR